MGWGTVEGPITVSDEQSISGTVAGDVTVVEGGDLKLAGSVLGSLTVEAGNASIHGSVMGDVTNSGGDLYFDGMIQGHLREDGGTTKLSDRTVVLNR